VALRPDGSGRATLVAEPRRNHAVPLREFLANEPGRARENVERWLSQSVRGVDGAAPDPAAPRALSRPVRRGVRFRGDDVAVAQAGGLALRPTFSPQPLQRYTSAGSRELPLLLGVPDSEHSEVRYRLPAGWAPVALPPPVQLEAPFGSYSLAWSFDDGVLVATRRRALSAPRIEAPEYPEFREFASRADAADSRTVIVRPEGR